MHAMMILIMLMMLPLIIRTLGIMIMNMIMMTISQPAIQPATQLVSQPATQPTIQPVSQPPYLERQSVTILAIVLERQWVATHSLLASAKQKKSGMSRINDG